MKTKLTGKADNKGERTSHVYFAYHVPKCAGSSIDYYIAQNFGDQFLRPARLKAPRIHFSSRNYQQPEMGALEGIRFVSGHWIGRSLEACFPGRPIRQSILLRDPLGFYLSYYNYRMKRYQSQGMQAFSFDLFYRTRPLNPVSSFILTRVLEIPAPLVRLMSSEEKLHRIHEGLRDFWFVGSYRDCDQLLAMIAREEGGSVDFASRNKNPHKAVTEATLTDGQVNRIMEENSLDQALYEHYCMKGDSAVAFSPSDPLKAILKDFQRPFYSYLSHRLRELPDQQAADGHGFKRKVRPESW
ncbi:hypothetical protein [uncultured Cohaesibacter sp.]|uniref:hypothetical protein n=1 Tax=uncultured Cohaesibacter sp. TaxID=1002546 RepID=UPI0029C86A4A|nr:hypothetical protein [uncultured Cohaesibacter sp.]